MMANKTNAGYCRVTDHEMCLAIYKCRQKNKGNEDLAKSEFMGSYVPCDKGECDRLFALFDEAFKAGVNSVITCGESTPTSLSSHNPLWIEAFHFGARTFRKLSTPMPVKVLKWGLVIGAIAGLGYLIAWVIS